MIFTETVTVRMAKVTEVNVTVFVLPCGGTSLMSVVVAIVASMCSAR